VEVANNVARLSEDDIGCQLRRICQMEEAVSEPNAVGLLTTLSRDQWANCRHALLKGWCSELSLLASIPRILFRNGEHHIKGQSCSQNDL